MKIIVIAFVLALTNLWGGALLKEFVPLSANLEHTLNGTQGLLYMAIFIGALYYLIEGAKG